MAYLFKRLDLQLFADGGEGSGEAAADTGVAVAAPAAGEDRLRELGVPESVLAKRANRVNRGKAEPQAQAAQAQPGKPQGEAAAPAEETPKEEQKEAAKRLTWDEIKADPEYKAAFDSEMQSIIRGRLKDAGRAQERLAKLEPMISTIASHYGQAPDKIDDDALIEAVSGDENYNPRINDMMLKEGIPLEAARKIDRMQRENEKAQKEREETARRADMDRRMKALHEEAEKLKGRFPKLDFFKEMDNPSLARDVLVYGKSFEDAYWSAHHGEIEEDYKAAMQVTAQNTKQQVVNSVMAGAARPKENGVGSAAPSTSTFNIKDSAYRKAIREEVARRAARGEKLHPGEWF